ncbi:MAG TPA: hypothetical protein VMF86_01970 [Stellaceae bacterium]|nr:hypothetical protein [Stellaceae bacterium]
MPIRVRYYLLLALAAIAKRSGKATRRVVDAAKQQKVDDAALHIRLVTLLVAQALMATTDLALWLFNRALPGHDSERR